MYLHKVNLKTKKEFCFIQKNIQFLYYTANGINNRIL